MAERATGFEPATSSLGSTSNPPPADTGRLVAPNLNDLPANSNRNAQRRRKRRCPSPLSHPSAQGDMMALKHPCAKPRCPNLVSRGESYCPAHKVERQQQYDRTRPNPAQRGYDADHRKWRAAILKRDPICKACGREPSTFADHIVPIRQGGAKLDMGNGQGMCGRCHQAKRGEERHQYGDGHGWA